MARGLQLLFCLAVAVGSLAWWNYDNLVADLGLVRQLKEEPKQTETVQSTFEVERNGVRYHIDPKFDYELYGLVVSFRHHDGNYLIHRLWNDHLNVADVCVVWGTNAFDLDLNAFKFWNAEFTCYVQTQSNTAWRAFAMDKLSNNHLLTEDDDIREAIDSVNIGDQIHVKGYLSEYSNDDGFQRGTSTTRTDTGNGACETIYVKSFEVLRIMPSGWRNWFGIAWWSAGLSAIAWLVGVGTGRI